MNALLNGIYKYYSEAYYIQNLENTAIVCVVITTGGHVIKKVRLSLQYKREMFNVPYSTIFHEDETI